jgi:hypothetical protein
VEIFPKIVKANQTDFVSDHRQAPEHSKPPMFL